MNSKAIHGEWIGKNVRIIKASNKALEQLGGVVVDETKHLFVIETDKGELKIPKHKTQFLVDWNGVECDVDGDNLLASPEERIKRKVKR